MIPEAIPPNPISQTDGGGPLSPHLSTLFSNGGRAKVFADDREGGLPDAARLWGTTGDRPTRPASEARSSVEWVRNNNSASPTKESALTIGPQHQPAQRNPDGGMLFEMDVPAVAYGTVTTGGIAGVQIGPLDLASPKAAVTSTMAEETDNNAAHVRDVAAMAERMDNIETERIPCPRLCGASFGPGIGGLAMFNNGDVKKMWLWYDRASSSRLACIPSAINAPEKAFSGSGNPDNAGVNGNHNTADLKVLISRDCPRTMKDLMDMTAAAKEAQWGEVNESGAESDDQEQSAGDNFFEYMSTGSLSSDSDNEPADFSSMGGGKGSRIYENYFGNYRRPVAEPSTGNSKISDEHEQQSLSSRGGSVQALGPSSDNLAPNVHVTHDFDKLALNSQSAQLAKDWELGQWQPDPADIVIVNQERLTKKTYFPDHNLENFREGMIDTPESPGHRGQKIVAGGDFLLLVIAQISSSFVSTI